MGLFLRAAKSVVSTPSLCVSSSACTPSYMRVMLSGADQQTPDKQGRITIAPPLRAYASLSRELAVNGVGSRLEIWDAATWDAYLAEQESVFASTAEEIIPGFF